MLETISVFDNLEHDQTEHRVASRRALALAHARCDQRFGAFLSGASDELEFNERVALVRDDFVYAVNSASEEVGNDTPEHIAAALLDHYKVAAGVQFKSVDPLEEEEEDEDQRTAAEKTALTPQDVQSLETVTQHAKAELGAPPQTAYDGDTEGLGGGGYVRLQGKTAGPNLNIMDSLTAPGQPSGAASTPPNANLQGAPAATPPMPNAATLTNPQGGGGAQLPPQGINPQVNPQTQPTPNGVQQPVNELPSQPGEHSNMLAYARWEIVGSGKQGSPLAQPQTPIPHDVTQLSRDALQRLLDDPQISSHAKMTYLQQWERANGSGYDTSFDASNDPYSQDYGQIGGGIHPYGAAQNPADQNDDSSRLVTCPVCGGTDSEGCSKCGGKGKVHNFGGSVLDALDDDGTTSSVRWRLAENGNTGLDGPSPKMDKRRVRELPENPEGALNDSGLWPTKRKDIIEPIKAENREINGEPNHVLKEIGEQTTEHVELDSGGVTDHGFYDGGETKAPSTETWHDKGGQADPVTRATQSSWPSESAVQRAFA